MANRAVVPGTAGVLRRREKHVGAHLGRVAAHGNNSGKAGKVRAQVCVGEHGGGLAGVEIEERRVDGIAQRRIAGCTCGTCTGWMSIGRKLAEKTL